MLAIQSFTFNPFQENTYLLSNEDKDCIIVDPGCYEPYEKEQLLDYIQQNNLTPVRLINTHGHIDHMLGNNFVFEKFGLKPEIHKKELTTLLATAEYAHIYNINIEATPAPEVFLSENEKITFGPYIFEVAFVPGHSPGHIALICHSEKVIISGDVLFDGSIGRTDLPGGDMDTLLQSIKEHLLILDDDYVVYPGHGTRTTIGKERKSNPFLQHLV